MNDFGNPAHVQVSDIDLFLHQRVKRLSFEDDAEHDYDSWQMHWKLLKETMPETGLLIFTNDKKPFYLTNDDSLLYYLQRLRDEAHRFAIGSHRSKRSKAISKNPLDDINGIGAKRKKALLNHFGSARAVARAGLLDLEEVDGISTAVAHIVYNHFNTNA